MKTRIANGWMTTMAMAATSLALIAPASAQDTPNAPSNVLPIPDPDPKQIAEPAPSSATEIRGTVQRVDGHLLTLTGGEQLVFIPGMTHQTGELSPGATIKASYAESAGRKVITRIRVEPM